MKKKNSGNNEAMPGAAAPHSQSDVQAGKDYGVELVARVRKEIDATVALVRSKVRTLAVNNREYQLEFSFQKLVAAERFFTFKGEAGSEASLLFCMSPATLNVSRLQTLIACAAHTHQPELSFDQAKALVNEESLYTCLNIAYDVLIPESLTPAAVDALQENAAAIAGEAQSA